VQPELARAPVISFIDWTVIFSASSVSAGGSDGPETTEIGACATEPKARTAIKPKAEIERPSLEKNQEVFISLSNSYQIVGCITGDNDLFFAIISYSFRYR
jgi:hypothetical protein